MKLNLCFHDDTAVNHDLLVSLHSVQTDNELWLKTTTTHHENCTVYGLSEGTQYAFRVRAVTVYGTSKPGESSDPITLPRLDSMAETLPQDMESTEATQAIATEQELGSTEEDVTLTVTKYDSDEERSSLDVDEFINEDLGAPENVSPGTVPDTLNDSSDYASFVPSSVMKLESADVSDIDYDHLAKRASRDLSETLALREGMEQLQPEVAMKVSPERVPPQKKQKTVKLTVQEHSFEIVPYIKDDVFDLLQDEPRCERATRVPVPLTVSCVLTVTSWNSTEPASTEPIPSSKGPLAVQLVPHVFTLVVFSPPLVISHTQDFLLPEQPDAIRVKVVTLAEWNMYRNLLPQTSFLIIDVANPLVCGRLIMFEFIVPAVT